MPEQVKKIAIIDYGSGNIRSVAKALEHVIVREDSLNFEVLITNNPKDVALVDRIILPGQGDFADCMAGLKATKGMIESLETAVLEHKVPFLGVCVGMQLLATQGLEHGTHAGLNWIAGEVVPLTPSDKTLKIPHMGWNEVTYLKGYDHPILKNQRKYQKDGAHFYFVHSFMFQCKDKDHVFLTSDYGGNVTALIAKENIVGVQFHPEKSQEAGLELLADFLKWIA
jgi:glutamine amidotransferase